MQVFVSSDAFDSSADIESTYEKVLSIDQVPTVEKNEYYFDVPKQARFVIFKKFTSSSEYLGFSEIELMGYE